MGDKWAGARTSDPTQEPHQKVRAPSTMASDDPQETTTPDASYSFEAEVITLDSLYTYGS